MSGSEWQRVAALAELEDGVPIAVELGQVDVLVVRVGDHVYAIGNRCNHSGSQLHKGCVCGHEVVCPSHNARFDLRTGERLGPPALNHAPRYPVKLEGDDVFVGPVEFAKPPAVSDAGDRTIVVLGAGAAGHAAAETLREQGFDGRVAMVTAEDVGPYDRPKLTKQFLSQGLEAKAVLVRRGAYYERLKVELQTGRQAVGVDLDGRRVRFEDGDDLAFDQLLLATGCTARRIPIPGCELPGYFTLRSLADAEALVAALADARSVVVLGASFIGLEVAAAVRQRDLPVHVAAAEDAPMARVFGERVGRHVQQAHEANGVVFHMGVTADRIEGGARVEAVVLSDGTRLECDCVVAGLGAVPVVDYLEGTGLVEDGAVPVDGRLQTRASGVFAAGDIAAYPDPRTGRPTRIEHWVVAERQGAHAARAMLGADDVYADAPFFWSYQAPVEVQYVGHAREFDHIAYRGDVAEGRFLAGYYEQGRLAAAAGFKKWQDVILLGKLLEAGVDIAPDAFEDESIDLRGLLPA